MVVRDSEEIVALWVARQDLVDGLVDVHLESGADCVELEKCFFSVSTSLARIRTLSMKESTSIVDVSPPARGKKDFSNAAMDSVKSCAIKGQLLAPVGMMHSCHHKPRSRNVKTTDDGSRNCAKKT